MKGVLFALISTIALVFNSPSVVHAQTTAAAVCNADINKDGIVDVTDFSQIALNYSKLSPTNVTTPRADINSDGIVDLSDYSMFVLQYSKDASGCLVSQSGPVVQNLSLITPASGKYQKIEWVFDLNKSYTNPYYSYDPTDTASSNPANTSWFGVDGVTVDMNVVTPSGKKLVVPAFWMEDYTRVKDNNFSSQGNEVLGKKDNGRWHVRFTPEESGTYSYSITATDKSGSNTIASQNFSVSATAQGHGFIRPSSIDSRFLAYSDGTSYVPISSGRQWWNDNVARSYDYENAFTKFGQNGVNLTRIWDQVDFALSVEGVGQPLWIDQNTVYGAAKGVEINTANVHSGMRTAHPGVGTGWYQRIAFTDTTKTHKLTVWLKTDSVTGGVGQVVIKTGTSFNSGTTLAQTTAVTGTTGWTQYSATFTPNTTVGSINLIHTAGTGNVYVDDIAVGPTDNSGNITYNIVSDSNFERHFYKGNPNNDPDTTPTLARPIGTYMNQWAGYEMDKIVESAAANGVAIQDCSCSGPWFTWPKDPSGNITDSDWGSQWFLKFNQRNFRYRVARWGYSPAILAWELHNEQGHVNPSGTPGVWAFLQKYAQYQTLTDPYTHIRTTSQNSQAYSPAMWSTFYDLANYHWYLDGHITTLDPDEALTINRFAWCLRDIAKSTASGYCTGLGLGDGTTWTDAAKPWFWGEIGVGLDGTKGNTALQGATFLHNKTWAGLFSPLGTTPIEWWWYQEDATATNSKFASTKAAAAFFSGVNYAGSQFSFIMTPTDVPPSYSGETVGTTNTNIRVYAMKSADKKSVYAWIANRAYVWSNTTTPTAASTTITITNLLNTNYVVTSWSTTMGVPIASQQVTVTNGTLTFPVSNLATDVAYKIFAP